NDLVELLQAVWEQKLDTVQIKTDPRTACTVMAVSGGYPGDYEKGFEIEGLDLAEQAGGLVFHAGTMAFEDVVMTNGGRVLCVTAFGHSVADAVARSQKALENIYFDRIYYRSDIGYEFMDAAQEGKEGPDDPQ